MTVQNERVRQPLGLKPDARVAPGVSTAGSRELNEELRYASSSNGNHRRGVVHPQRQRRRRSRYSTHSIRCEHSFLNGWRESIGAVLTQQLDRVRQMAKRLSAFTSLAKYVAPDAPLWRTRRIDDALAASDAFMDALNGGDQTGQRLCRCREVPCSRGIGLRRIR